MKVDMGLIEDLANVLQFSFHKDYGGALSAKQIEAAEAAIKRRLVEEIEACAKIAEELVPDFEPIPCPDGDPTCLVAHARNIKRHRSWREIAAAIRARGKTEG